MDTLGGLIAQKPRLKYLFTGGKGGVGKTIAAAALAYHFSQQGKRTLVASLNPVHSPTSVFGQDLSDGVVKPVQDASGLYAVEVVKPFITMVRSYDIAIGGVIVNEVLRREAVEATQGEEYLTNKYHEQLNYLRTIKQDLGGLVRGFVPLYPQEVVGMDSLARVAEDLFRFVPNTWQEL